MELIYKIGLAFFVLFCFHMFFRLTSNMSKNYLDDYTEKRPNEAEIRSRVYDNNYTNSQYNEVQEMTDDVKHNNEMLSDPFDNLTEDIVWKINA